MDEQYKTDIAILKNDLRQQVEVAEKIHTTLEKLGEISTNISRILAVRQSHPCWQRQPAQACSQPILRQQRRFPALPFRHVRLCRRWHFLH